MVRHYGAPLLIGASALCQRRFQAPSGCDFRPALIAKLVPEQRYHRLWVARRVTQTVVQPPHFAAVVGIGAEQPGGRRVQSQPTGLQHSPHPTQAVAAKPRHRHPHRAQRPAAGHWATCPYHHFPAGSRAGPGV